MSVYLLQLTISKKSFQLKTDLNLNLHYATRPSYIPTSTHYHSRATYLGILILDFYTETYSHVLIIACWRWIAQFMRN